MCKVLHLDTQRICAHASVRVDNYATPAFIYWITDMCTFMTTSIMGGVHEESMHMYIEFMYRQLNWSRIQEMHVIYYV